MYYLKLKNIVEELNFRIGGINTLLQIAERENDLPNSHRVALGEVWTDLEFLSTFLSSFARQKRRANFYDVELEGDTVVAEKDRNIVLVKDLASPLIDIVVINSLFADTIQGICDNAPPFKVVAGYIPSNGSTTAHYRAAEGSTIAIESLNPADFSELIKAVRFLPNVIVTTTKKGLVEIVRSHRKSLGVVRLRKTVQTIPLPYMLALTKHYPDWRKMALAQHMPQYNLRLHDSRNLVPQHNPYRAGEIKSLIAPLNAEIRPRRSASVFSSPYVSTL